MWFISSIWFTNRKQKHFRFFLQIAAFKTNYAGFIKDTTFIELCSISYLEAQQAASEQRHAERLQVEQRAEITGCTETWHEVRGDNILEQRLARSSHRPAGTTLPDGARMISSRRKNYFYKSDWSVKHCKQNRSDSRKQNSKQKPVSWMIRETLEKIQRTNDRRYSCCKTNPDEPELTLINPTTTNSG